MSYVLKDRAAALPLSGSLAHRLTVFSCPT